MRTILKELQPLIVQAAREELLPRFRQISHEFKADGSMLTEADLAMQQRVQTELSSHWPEYSFLAEEMTSQQQQSLLENNSSGLWCLDPLDGTSNFAMGIPFFAVSLALIQEGEIKLGLVYDPIRDECFTASKGEGVWLNNDALPSPQTFPTEPVIGIIDYKRLPSELAVGLAQNPPFKSQRSLALSLSTGAGWRQVVVMSICMDGKTCGIMLPVSWFSTRPGVIQLPWRVSRFSIIVLSPARQSQPWMKNYFDNGLPAYLPVELLNLLLSSYIRQVSILNEGL